MYCTFQQVWTQKLVVTVQCAEQNVNSSRKELHTRITDKRIHWAKKQESDY